LADIKDFTGGMDFPAYQTNAMCRAAVERKFEVIGEACTRLRDRFPEPFSHLASGPQIIGFRNLPLLKPEGKTGPQDSSSSLRLELSAFSSSFLASCIFFRILALRRLQ